MADLASELSKYGIDYADAIDRFDGDGDFYKTLALKYLENDQFVNLVAAMEVKDFNEGYEAAHTLKGVSGNLSFAELYKASAAVSEALNQGEYQAAESLMPEVKSAHEKVIQGLVAWQDGELD